MDDVRSFHADGISIGCWIFVGREGTKILCTYVPVRYVFPFPKRPDVCRRMDWLMDRRTQKCFRLPSKFQLEQSQNAAVWLAQWWHTGTAGSTLSNHPVVGESHRVSATTHYTGTERKKYIAPTSTKNTTMMNEWRRKNKQAQQLLHPSSRATSKTFFFQTL